MRRQVNPWIRMSRMAFALIAGVLLMAGTARLHVHSLGETAGHHHASLSDVITADADASRHGDDHGGGTEGGGDLHIHPCGDTFAMSHFFPELAIASPTSVVTQRVVSLRAPDDVPLSVDLPPAEIA